MNESPLTWHKYRENDLLSITRFAEKDIKSLLIHTVNILMIIYRYNDTT